MRPAGPSVSAVLPAYNEAGVIVEVVRATEAALVANAVSDYEVIVVDDGSTDGTGDLVRAMARDPNRVRVVAHKRNRGYGAALRTGFEAARLEATWLMDSDGQFDPADIRLLLEHWTPQVIVVGWRRDRNDHLVRRMNHDAFFTLVRLRWGRLARDINCAFKLFPSALGRGLRAEGAMISTELLLRARRSGYEVIEVPVPHYARRAGTPTGANPRVVARAFRELWSMAVRRDEPALVDAAAPD